MHRTRPWRAGQLLGLVILCQTGCAANGMPQGVWGAAPARSTTGAHDPRRAVPATPGVETGLERGANENAALQTCSAGEEKGSSSAKPSSPVTATVAATAPALFGDAAELPLEALIEQVLVRNPTIAQMAAAYQAAQARYPQAVALDDPMFDVGIGPATIGADDVNFAYRVQISQRYPWHGKRALRGASALALASAAGHDIDDVRLQLIEATRSAFYDYYLAERALGVNDEADRLLKEFHKNALARFSNNLAPEQDVRQADVEIGRTRERRLALERMRQVAVARINTLLHLSTAAPLPPPPAKLPATEPLPEVRALQDGALAARPDLKALADRIAAEEAALALAYKEYYPDVTPFFMWDRFMGNREVEMAPQIGVQLNLPVRRERRAAALAEASARIAERQAELAGLIDQVNFQIEEAYQQVRESEKAVRLYDETILKAADQNVKAALAAYTTGKVPFLSLLEAERSLVELRDRYYETTADMYRRRARLERVTGGTPAAPSAPSPANTSTAPTEK
jgi:outer membrane protein, heavy metal efflux system